MRTLLRTSILPAVVTLLLLGCAAVPDPVNFEKHAFVVSSDGNLLVPDLAQMEAENEPSSPFRSIENPEAFVPYYKNIVDSIVSSKRKKILIYIHGGLNSLGASTERANRKSAEIFKEGQYYPIFINWDSGMLGSYFEHLTFVRQGQEAPVTGPLTAVFYGVYDIGRSVVRAPITWGYTIYNDYGALGPITIEAERNADAIYDYLRANEPWAISRGAAEPFGVNTVLNAIWYGATWPFQIVVAPFVDGFGASAWQNQLRRSKVVFERSAEFDVMGESAGVRRTLSQSRSGAVSVFFRTLQSELGDRLGDYEITLIGHSMGVIISNEVLRRFPDLPVERVVYMAGADSIANTLKATVPHLLRHGSAKLYILTLHPNNEKAEVNVIGLAPRGSLLVWLDNYFTTPDTPLERTVGNWDNILAAVGQFPPKVMPRVNIKGFDEDSCVTRHGDFGNPPFWREAFWLPGPHESNPCP